ncbi:CoA-binding protein [Escherichia coli]
MKETDIAGILTSTHTIALVGKRQTRSSQLSRDEISTRPGYHVIPVSPKVAGKTLLGQQGMARWQTFRKKSIWSMFSVIQKAAWGVAQEAIAIGAKTLWMQLVINEQAAVLARDAGLNVVMDCCPAIEIPRLGLAK